MGSSRRRVAPGTVCYLCGLEIAPDQAWNRDHVPPLRFFAKSVRKTNGPQLEWLATHASCNSSYREDEEYFCVAFAPQAMGSPTGDAVTNDIQRAFQKGHARGLGKAVLRQLGSVELPDGTVAFHYDHARTARVLWKLIRGLFFIHLQRVLPEQPPPGIELINGPKEQERLREHGWFSTVRDTESLGHYGKVFDYKWLCVASNDLRGHALALLLWDQIVILSMFHDPLCPCGQCWTASR